MFVNTVLIPFTSGKKGGGESVEELNQRWTGDIIPHTTTLYDMVSSLDYGCNSTLVLLERTMMDVAVQYKLTVLLMLLMHQIYCTMICYQK